MYVLIRYSVGLIVEGVILARGKNRMRVVAAGFSDPIELRCSGSQWFTATHEPVEFDFLMSNAVVGKNVSSSAPLCVASAAGSPATQN